MTNEVSDKLQENIAKFMDDFITPFTLTDEGKTDIAEEICEMVVDAQKQNGMLKDLRAHAYDAQEVAKSIAKEHRTHQASIINNLIAIVSEYHLNANGADLRNQAAIEASEKVAALNIFIPMI